MKTTQPLLRIGTYGTHVTQNHGVFAFTGTVPHDIKRGGYPTLQAAINAFADWFTAQDEPFRREHLTNLRDDVVGALFRPVTPEDFQ
jgi:hypothetical protein|tara:strand:- start:40 stop:300 length:261 start_codon:yes stop_codon:yes gene_type:complete